MFYWESVWHSLPKFLLFLLANIVSGEGNVQAATENWSWKIVPFQLPVGQKSVNSRRSAAFSRGSIASLCGYIGDEKNIRVYRG